MIELITGLVLFTSAASSATLLQVVGKFSYTKNPLLFLSLFIIWMSVVATLLGYVPNVLWFASVVVMASVYVFVITAMVWYWKPMKQLYRTDTVPAPYQGLVSPQLSGQLVKVTEVLLQDFSAWLIVAGLLVISNGIITTCLLFTGIVFLLHIGGLRLFGPLYGGYFLVLSTSLAFLIPILYQLGLTGFLLLYGLHLSGYVFMYLLFGYWGKQKRTTI